MQRIRVVKSVRRNCKRFRVVKRIRRSCKHIRVVSEFELYVENMKEYLSVKYFGLWLSFRPTNRCFINAVVFLSLKKAFVTVDHMILLSKFQAYGIQGS